MRAVIDTCVIVDALQSREPFCKDAQSIFLLCANRQFDGFLTAKAITDIYYLTHRQMHSDKATRDVLTKLCALFCWTPRHWTSARQSRQRFPILRMP